MQPSLKAELRALALLRRNQLDPLERERLSAAICMQVAALPLVQAAAVVHCYLPFRSEVDTLPLLRLLLERGQRVVVPIVVRHQRALAQSWLHRLHPDDLVAGVYGTPQPRHPDPAPPGVWGVTIVPLAAFCRRGYRLGYGKGFYDALLAAYPTPTVGVAFAVQQLEQIPAEPHDQRLDWIVTEQGVVQSEPADTTF